MRSWCVSALLFGLLAVLGCGGGGAMSNGGSSGTGGGTPSGTPGNGFTPDHVFVVVLENHSFSQVIGSSSMPYLNSLASAHALAASYFADTHPSLGNYFMLTVGNIETNPIVGDSFSGPVTDNNIVRALTGAGKTWKGYMESLPSTGYTGADVYPYVKRHNPFAYLSDVLNSSAQAANIVSFSQITSDLSGNALPSYAFIVPNVENDAHDCPTGGSACLDSDKLMAADNWLRSHIDPLITNPALANSVFFITFDEGLDIDVIHGGGQVATVIVGAHVKPAFQSMVTYQHENLLRTVLDLLKVNSLPGASASAASMSDCFQ